MKFKFDTVRADDQEGDTKVFIDRDGDVLVFYSECGKFFLGVEECNVVVETPDQLAAIADVLNRIATQWYAQEEPSKGTK